MLVEILQNLLQKMLGTPSEDLCAVVDTDWLKELNMGSMVPSLDSILFHCKTNQFQCLLNVLYKYGLLKGHLNSYVSFILY